MAEVKLNKEQSKKFAKAIFADIKCYVENHKDEYEEFIQNENLKNIINQNSKSMMNNN